ncbi:SRPBCC family protein [Aestuariirhabdus sp. Z084]|uniref:SRPBCC family protein n=1 Tax=Aestuariirhabdus haliotis TaxID=2918751 RepID=UPI00201B37AF|nr:SRPBCC family protein [Aestuariirhabdus haliotis]MCL6416250.1 SRPBCC family protein [Aestuariirhabdus haliotis]MCL6420290.1 SRPBCC family protein [Aestuariirhabdus haliotis]
MPTIEATIETQSSPREMYEYISQPWLWHEWHPNSIGATANVETLSIGDTYTEAFEIKPFPLLPFTLRRKLHYRVIDAKPYHYWEVKAEAENGSADIHFKYYFDAMDNGGKFTRVLKYQLHGPMRLLAPLLKRTNTRVSQQAMENLQHKWNTKL